MGELNFAFLMTRQSFFAAASRAQKWCGDAQLLIDARPFLALAADGVRASTKAFFVRPAPSSAHSLSSLYVCVPENPWDARAARISWRIKAAQSQHRGFTQLKRVAPPHHTLCSALYLAK
jgi:hypothetical protein